MALAPNAKATRKLTPPLSRIFVFLLPVFILSIFEGCFPRPVSRQRIDDHGTFHEIMVVGKTKNERGKILSDAVLLLKRINRNLDPVDPMSEISKINKHGFENPQPVSLEIFWLIKQSIEFFEKSGGAFDITAYPLTQLWGFDEKSPRLPEAVQIQGLLPRIGSNLLELNEKKNTVKFQVPGVAIDLRTVGKGYACDEIIEFLKGQGVEDALVNIGGTIRVLGKSPEGKSWRVGLRHPRDPTRTLRVVSLENEAVSTRGDDEVFFVVNGRRFFNILNPRTGYPAHESVVVSVIAPSALLADALSTSLFVLGPEKTPTFIRQFQNVRWYLTYFSNGDHFKTLSSEPTD